MGKGRDQHGGHHGSGRREPKLESPRSRPDDLRAYPEDRAVGGRRPPSGKRERIEPGMAPSRMSAGEIDPMRSEGARSSRRAAKTSTAARRVPRRRFTFGRLAYWAAVAGLWVCLGLAGIVGFYATQLPPIDQLAVPKRPPNIAIVADDGTPLVNRGDTGGAAVRLRDLPPYLPKAFVAIEDRRFYHHWGIDPLGIGRAMLRNVAGSGGMQGGSTLTQQLAKNLFLTQERTLSRKVQEAILALWLEHKYSKDQLLELYLNRVYFGSGAYGVEAAANHYFGKSARAVTLAEAAVLAGLMKAPTKLAPNRNPTAATERAAQVVGAMAEEGYVSDAAAKAALANPAKAVKEHAAGAINYAADYVMDMLDDTVGAVEDDIVVTTTLNPALETAGERALADGLNRSGGKYGVSQGALVTMDPDGSIRALIGGRDYSDSQFNRAVQAKRQPGSAFKPFVYLAAVERGLTPDTVRDDAPINVKGWQPENYSREDFADQGSVAVAEHGCGAARPRGRPQDGGKDRAPARHRVGPAAQCLDRPRHLRGDAARAHGGLRRLRQWRHRGAAAHHHPSEDHRRQAALPAQECELRPGDRRPVCRHDERHDAGDPADRHRPQGRTAGLAGGGQDRHQPGLARRLVRGLYEPAGHRRVARQRRRLGHQEGVRRQPPGRDLEQVHDRGASWAAAAAAPRDVARAAIRSWV